MKNNYINYRKTNNYFRKKNNEGFAADKQGNLKQRPQFAKKDYDKELVKSIKDGGLFTKFIMSGLDLIITSTITFTNTIFRICFKDGFNSLISNEDSLGKISKKELAKSSVYIDLIYFRYLLTLVCPPIGVFLSKGIRYGWFNILVTSVLCYLNYFVGIIYAFLICFSNKYAEIYFNKEKLNLEKYKIELKNENIDLDARKYNLLAMLVLIFLTFLGIFGLVKLFSKINIIKNKN